MNKDSKILITGGGGMLGRALIKKLKEQGYTDIQAPRRWECNLVSAYNTFTLFSDSKPEYVFHLAASVHGIGGNAAYPADILSGNTRINENVVRCASYFKIEKIVAMGSGCIYPDFQHAMREDEIFNGIPHTSEFAYAHAKRHMLAHLIAENAQTNLNYAYVISGNLYGPHDTFDPDIGHVIPSLIYKFHRAQKENTFVNAWGCGAAIRDFMYSEDAAEALIEIMLKVEGPVNMGSGSLSDIKGVVRRLSALHEDVEVVWNPDEPNGQAVRIYNLDRLNTTGFKARTSLAKGLEKTVNWYRG